MTLMLSSDQLEQLAELVAEKLAARQGELIDAAELARRLGRSRDFVYEHAEELGALRVGSGPRPRKLFPWPLHHVGDVLHGDLVLHGEEDHVRHASRRAVRPPAAKVDLLPIRGQR